VTAFLQVPTELLQADQGSGLSLAIEMVPRGAAGQLVYSAIWDTRHACQQE
jgi:hypothetical protein